MGVIKEDLSTEEEEEKSYGRRCFVRKIRTMKQGFDFALIETDVETRSRSGNSVKFSSRNCIRSSGLAFNIGLGAWRAARLNIIDIDSRRDVVPPPPSKFF